MTEYPEGDKLKTFAELIPEDENTNKIVLEGLIVAMSNIEHYDNGASGECSKCHEKITDTCLLDGIDFREWKPNLRCFDCNKPVRPKKKYRGRVRKILLQEDIMQNPQSITAFLFGDNTLKVQAGDKVAVRGQLRSVKKNLNSTTYQRFFDINQIIIRDKIIEMPDKLTIAKYNNIEHEDLIKSFAPNIKDMDVIKEGLLMSLIGGVNTPDVRGDINTMLVGDPGTAKTKLLQFITKISTPSAYASGRSASAAGLLAGVDNLSDGTRVARAGIVTLCNGGVVALDEMDKMSSVDRSALHESMETQKFSLVKIGINRVWEVKTTIIGAGNPYGGNKYDPSISIKDNIRLPDSLLSRFALIFLVLDEPNLDHDLEVARHIISVRQKKVIAPLSEDELSMYINYAKSFNPVINDEAGEKLLHWWSELRQESQPEKAPAVDHRVMEDLNRLTEAYARSRFSNEANLLDAQRAINLLKESLKTLHMNTPGEKAEASTRTMNKEEYFQNIFKEPKHENQAIIEMMIKKKWWKSAFAAKRYIYGMYDAGLLAKTMVEGEYVWEN